MFRKIKKDRSRILMVSMIEIILAIAAIISIILLQDKFLFVKEYAPYIVIGYFLLIALVNIIVLMYFLKSSEKYLDRTDITISSIFGNEVAPVFNFGDLVILVYNEEDEIIWVSKTTLIKKEDVLGKKIYDIIPDFDEMTIQENEKEIYTKLEGKTFQTEINTGLKVIYLKDVSTEVIQNTKIEEERPFIGHIVIDNYQDIIVSLQEASFVTFVTEVKDAVLNWSKKYNLFIRSYGNDSFLIIGEEKSYQEILKDNFSVIDDVRKLAAKDDNPLTISIGIGKGYTTSILRTSEIAYNALNMALSRGGDQIVVNNFGSPMEYYGAKNEVKQTRSHIRGRVLATSLASLIKDENRKNVIIMGHKNMDFDALGASIGVWTICKSLKVKAFFVFEDALVDYQTKNAFRSVFTAAEINEMTVTPAKALQISNDQTLVVVVDTHRPESTMQPKILERCQDICVIDHHRKGDNFISNPIFQYHEPQSSSASELVTELIYYQPTKIDVSDKVANFLLAGICLDTKFFKSSSSGKTFEMSMVLRNYQASVETVSEFFKEEYQEMKLISSIAAASRSMGFGHDVYMAVADDADGPYTRSALAKAAEKILETKGVQAVFVVGRTNSNEISISARSLNDFNVQIIMQALGGGGHFSVAATQIPNVTIDEACSMLNEKVREFLRDYIK